jgi:glycosyltransferase involved in cell wall biosynthesis
LKKLWNFVSLFFKLWGIKRKENVKLMVGFLAIAGGYAFLISRVLRLQLLVFCFEPHSLYMKEFGIWSANSLKYKILRQVEIWQATKADYVTAPTKHTVQLLQNWNSKANISRVPISVDTDKFSFSAAARSQIRQENGVPEGRYAILYLGKFGGIYYSAQAVAEFCKRLLDANPSLFFFTISPNPSAEVEQAYLAAGLQPSDFVVLNKIPYSEIEGYISACDMGMVAIPPLDSQRYRTPVKIGNYLACGLPILLNKGIADDDDMAEAENVGVVFDSLNQKNIAVPLQQLRQLMQEDATTLQARCRAAAIHHRGLQNSVDVLLEIFDEVYSPSSL